VRRSILLVLSEIILKDKIKISKKIFMIAECVADSNNRIQDLAELFFFSSDSKRKKNSNSILNLIPVILFQLSNDSNLKPILLQTIMSRLLCLFKKKSHIVGLIEKFLFRMLYNMDIKQKRNIAFCLSQLSFSETEIRKLIGFVKMNQNIFFDGIVMGYLHDIIGKLYKAARENIKKIIDEEILRLCLN